MERSVFTTKTAKMRNIEFKNFVEMLSKMAETNMNCELAYIIAKNLRDLTEDYIKLMSELYDPQRDPDYVKFNEGSMAIANKHADRDEQGNIIFDKNGKMMINDQVVEFQEAMNKYNEENKELIETFNKKLEKNNEIMQETVERKLFTWDVIENIPKNADMSPALFAFLAGDVL